MIFLHHFFVGWTHYTGLLCREGRHSGGGGGFADAPRSVIAIEGRIIYRRF